MTLRGLTMTTDAFLPAAILTAMGLAWAAALAWAAPGGATPAAKPAPTFQEYVKGLSEQALARRNERSAGLKTQADALRWARDLKQWYRGRVGPIVPLAGPQKRELCGKIQRDGYHVEKWLFETMPGTWARK